jgi:limonene-1,2-epoxide hydrolase
VKAWRDLSQEIVMRRRQFIQASTGAALAASASASGASKRVSKSDKASFATVLTLIEAWKRQDIDAVMSHIADDIVWHSHVGSPVVRGKAAMRAFLERMAAGVTDIRWRVQFHSISGNRIFMEGVDDFVMADTKRRVAIPYLGVMVFRSGLISEWRDYFDRALFDRMKAGEPTPPDVAALADRPGQP